MVGLPCSPDNGWRQNRGLRLVAGGRTLDVPWPGVAGLPNHGLVRTRLGFDEELARHARSAGARLLEHHQVTQALRSDDGRVTGVRATILDGGGHRTGQEQAFFADVVLAADGNASRTAVSLGIQRRRDRPMGVAVRSYFVSPRHDEDWLECRLGLPGRNGGLLPGYGWIFGMGDGTANVGLGVLDSARDFDTLDYKRLLLQWSAGLPREWGFTPENQVGEIRGGALPMGFNRTPPYAPGLMLLGDAGGMVSPCDGEGVSYAMESGRLAAECVIAADAAGRSGSGRSTVDEVLAGYADRLREQWGPHFALGRALAEFAGKSAVMKLALHTGMPIPALMRFMVRLLGNLGDPAGRDFADRAIGILEQLASGPADRGPGG